MIKFDISTLIFFHIFCSAMIILLIWVLYGYRGIKRIEPKDVDYIWKCSMCLQGYIDSTNESISICPMCGSYNKREKGKVAA